MCRVYATDHHEIIRSAYKRQRPQPRTGEQGTNIFTYPSCFLEFSTVCVVHNSNKRFVSRPSLCARLASARDLIGSCGPYDWWIVERWSGAVRREIVSWRVVIFTAPKYYSIEPTALRRRRSHGRAAMKRLNESSYKRVGLVGKTVSDSREIRVVAPNEDRTKNETPPRIQCPV